MFNRKQTYYNSSYSQEGEDLVVDRYLNYQKKGFYVDIGAMHPIRFSNTYHFYERGWRGVNIDATPGSMAEFTKLRSRDLNLELAISNVQENKKYYLFSEPALNTFSKKLANQYVSNGQKIVCTKTIKTNTLDEILVSNLKSNQIIDFMSIDVEGMELEVLKSFNLKRFEPKLILVESLRSYTISEAIRSELNKFLCKQHYNLAAKTYNTLIFLKK